MLGHAAEAVEAAGGKFFRESLKQSLEEARALYSRMTYHLTDADTIVYANTMTIDGKLFAEAIARTRLRGTALLAARLHMVEGRSQAKPSGISACLSKRTRRLSTVFAMSWGRWAGLSKRDFGSHRESGKKLTSLLLS